LDTVLRALLEFLALDPARWAWLGRNVLQPVIMVALLAFVAFGYVSWREGGLSGGWALVFADSKISALNREIELRAIVLDAEIRESARSDSRIREYLSALLRRVSGVARIRLGIIHDGTIGVAGSPLLRFDITHAVAVPGRVAGDLVQNQPTTGWVSSLPDLLAGSCHYQETTRMDYVAARDRLMSMGTAATVTCPVTNMHGQLLGALFVQFDSIDAVPTGAARVALDADAKDTGRFIAAAIDAIAR
jgi:hypothetical protein